MPRGTRHVLADSLRTRPVPFSEALAAMPARLAKLGAPARRSTTILVCAEIRFDLAGPHALMSALPEIVHLPADVAASDDDLQAVAKLLLREAASARTGSELLVPRLIDSLLILIVRTWLERQPLGDPGWLAALRDPQMGRALALIHESPADGWTVGSLAARVGMSRAPFARRFSALVGEPPLSYLTRWRMNVAAHRLRTTAKAAEAIASEVGYQSTTAFNAAFRRLMGLSPGRYRARARDSAPAGRALSAV